MLRSYPRQGSAPEFGQTAPEKIQSTQERLQVPLVSGGKDLLGTPAYPPVQLRLHPVFTQLGLVGTLINRTVYGRRPPEAVPEPILITSSGIVISGTREWHAAVSEGRQAVKCTEYQLSDDEALQMILILQQSRGVWNAFTRVQIALQQEPYLQAKAHANQVLGGKDKGSANLPEARQIEVRQEIAYLAGACPRNVSKVKAILLKAHPRLIEACQTGVVTIHCASKLCRRPKDEQLEDLTHCLNKRSNGKTTRQAIAISRMEKIGPKADLLLRALLQREARQPGSIVMRAGARKKTVILIGQDDWNDITAALAEMLMA
jgi:hypothetical protein